MFARLLVAGSVVGLLAGGLLAPVSAQDTTNVPRISTLASENTAQYLFTLGAASGRTQPLKKHNGESERFVLTLRGVGVVTKFADRPFRNATVLAPWRFTKHWHAWFAGSAPNAVVTFGQGDGRAPQSIVVTLYHPSYNAKNQRLRFIAVRIYRHHDPSSPKLNWKPPATPRTFSEANLFIDDSGSSVTDSLTAQLQQAMQQYVFSPNNANTWAAVEAALSNVLTQAWQQGSLMGPSAATAFSVTCQPYPEQILNGYLPCAVTMHLSNGTTFTTTLTQEMAN